MRTLNLYGWVVYDTHHKRKRFYTNLGFKEVEEGSVLGLMCLRIRFALTGAEGSDSYCGGV